MKYSIDYLRDHCFVCLFFIRVLAQFVIKESDPLGWIDPLWVEVIR